MIFGRFIESSYNILLTALRTKI